MRIWGSLLSETALRCVTDHLLGTDADAEAAIVALGVVDDGQVLIQSDGTLGADLLTQAAADAAQGAATGSDIALCVGGTGDDDVLSVLNAGDLLLPAVEQANRPLSNDPEKTEAQIQILPVTVQCWCHYLPDHGFNRRIYTKVINPSLRNPMNNTRLSRRIQQIPGC